MDLILVPNDPEHTVLVSPNGVAHYQVTTSKLSGGRRVTRIQRPAESEEASLVAEINWGKWDNPTVIRCPLLTRASKAAIVGVAEGQGVLATDFLYRKHKFSSSRYFFGDDAIEYRWKYSKSVGGILRSSDTDQEVARYTHMLTDEGLYAGERKARLRIQPCSVELDLIVLSFLIMEKKRRERSGGGLVSCDHDEDPQGDGGGDGSGGG